MITGEGNALCCHASIVWRTADNRGPRQKAGHSLVFLVMLLTRLLVVPIEVVTFSYVAKCPKVIVVYSLISYNLSKSQEMTVTFHLH